MAAPRFMVPTRQQAERIVSTTKLLAASAKFVSGNLRAEGYNAVLGLAVCDQTGTLRVLQAGETVDAKGNAVPDVFVQTNLLATALDALSGKQVVQVNVPVIGAYVQLEYDNGATAQGQFNLLAYLIPGTGAGTASTTSSGGTSAPVANRPTFATGQLRVAVPGTAQNLPATPIPDGVSIVVKAKKANAGLVYIGPTQAAAQAHTTAYSMSGQETIRYFLKNANAIWVDADNANEGVDWTVEQ